MIQSFHDDATSDIFNGTNTQAARRALPRELWRAAARKLERLDSVRLLAELAIPPANQLEPLRHDREGQHSIRINDQYRICFQWTEWGPESVEIVDYH